MSQNPWDHPEAKAFLRDAEEDMFPKLRDSAMQITLYSGKVDAKLCVELGAAILFNKPIVVVATGGEPLPANLARVATVIVEGDLNDPAVRNKLQGVIQGVIENDARARRSATPEGNDE